VDDGGAAYQSAGFGYPVQPVDCSAGTRGVLNPRWRLDLRTLTQADFDAIAQELNERPRQTLGFKTPSQALAEVLR
jgi:hypothetical protein